MDPLDFRQATHEDEPALRALLAAESLPVDDVSVERQDYLLAWAGPALVGCVGLEACGDAGLLRSFAVVSARRGQGLGRVLLDRIVAKARLRGVKTAYTLTTTAERWCLAHGFERVDRSQVPASINGTAQFRALCPAAAACFRMRLDGLAIHFPGDVLRLRADVPGAAAWAVGLDRAMLSYFEVEPRTRFETHRHDGEQITLVLEGELFFAVDGRGEFRVGAGEVIALPAGIPHAAWTGDRPARAVDAWSPPRPDLLR